MRGAHHQQELAPGGIYAFSDSANGFVLIVAASDVCVDRDTIQRLGKLPLVAQPLQVVPGVEARYLSGRVAFAIPKLNFLAVGEEYKRIAAKFCLDCIGVVGRLALSSNFIAG